MNYWLQYKRNEKNRVLCLLLFLLEVGFLSDTGYVYESEKHYSCFLKEKSKKEIILPAILPNKIHLIQKKTKSVITKVTLTDNYDLERMQISDSIRP